MTKLNDLRDNAGARKARMRVGRGIGSGKGKTAGRGVKGQTSRTGVAINGFEGGQMPLHRRLPKRGFRNIFAKEYSVVNLGMVQKAIDLGKLNAAETIDAAALNAAGVTGKVKKDGRADREGFLHGRRRVQVGDRSRREGGWQRHADRSRRRSRRVKFRDKPVLAYGLSGHYKKRSREGRPASCSAAPFALTGQGLDHGISGRAACRQHQFRGFLQGDRAEKADLVYLGGPDRLSAGHLHPDSGYRSAYPAGRLQAAGQRHPRDVRHAGRRCASPHDHLRAQHHAVHLGVHHRAVADRRVAADGGHEEGRRGRAQEAEPVHPIRHRRSRHRPGLRACVDARLDGGRGHRPRPVFPHRHGHHAGRRHHVPDVAGRADHRPRYRQRHLADHLRRHRRGTAARAGQHAGTRPPGRAVHRLHHPDAGDGGRRGVLHRLHGTRPAPPAGAVPEAPGRQPRVRRRSVAPAAEDEHRRRHPADLRVVAAAAAADRGRLRRRRGAGVAAGGVALRRARHAALHAALRLADRVLLLLLHRHCLQPDRDGRQPAQVWRLHPRHPSGQEHRRPHRLCADAADGHRLRLPCGGLSPPRNPDIPALGSVLFWRHQPADRGHRHDGHGCADSFPPAGPPV
ncbi:hypothetical protein Lal_00005328 [Lupinus albus]|nr:hypothetical protein Lal_00005328 [Lupinus albus]